MGHSKSNPKREVHRDISLPKKNVSNKQPNPAYTITAGTTTNKAPSK